MRRHGDEKKERISKNLKRLIRLKLKNEFLFPSKGQDHRSDSSRLF